MSTLIAAESDVRHAYRLLLNREPDPEGFEHYRKLVAREDVTTTELASSFLDSAEYVSQSARSPIEVPMGDYSLFVRADDRDIGTHIANTHEYEPHVTSAVREHLSEGDVFVDVGANIGFFTSLAAHLVGSTGTVIAIEPMEKNLQLIYRSLERNGFKHVHVHACAASDCMQVVRVATGPGTSNGQVLSPGDQQSTLYSQSMRLDDLLGEIERIDLVKIDIEGFEPRAWDGFRRAMTRCRPVVLSEFHPWCMRTFAQVDPLDYLRELFEYGRAVKVLPYHGSQIDCKGPAHVMEVWEASDKAMRGDGKNHLDLLVEPRQ